MPEPPKVFISCGQYTREERELGKEIARLVGKLTPYRAYFAESQTSLEGLTKHIFRALYESGGLIAIMHPRGKIETPDGKTLVRASVWIEQEIAIAGFVRQVLGGQIEVLAYCHEDICLEGAREHLHLNPTRFTSNEQVLEHLGNALPTWKISISKLAAGRAQLIAKAHRGAKPADFGRLVIKNIGNSKARKISIWMDGLTKLEHPCMVNDDACLPELEAGDDFTFRLQLRHGVHPSPRGGVNLNGPWMVEMSWEDDSGEPGSYRKSVMPT